MTKAFAHNPVLLTEVIENLAINPTGIYIDATFGRGGHSREILKRLASQGRLLVLDQDPAAIAFARQDPEFAKKNFHIEHTAFAGLKEFAERENIVGKVDGILFDLGVSSPQLEDATRGFSFMRSGPLDMRMNPQQGISAADWIATAREDEIMTVLRDYGEERYARRIANAIVRERQLEPITTTTRLAEIIKTAHPRWDHRIHPATRSFQGIRIFINQELEQIKLVLSQAVDVLAVGGKLLVISFHSLEDRIVKQFIRDHSQKNNSPSLKKIAKIKPTRAETLSNPRSRSALLRVAEKIGV